jgi:putative Mg2+ transporter-C (MgtC) family protein
MLHFWEWGLVGRMALSALLGYSIGFEREWRGKSAGERTFALIALGAAGFTAVGVEGFPASAEKVIAGVVTGVGFLGAGLIFRERTGGEVLGLTTAAAAWAVATIGVLVGAGAFLSGIGATLLVLFILEFNRLPVVGRLLTRERHGPEPGEHSPDAPG